MHGRRNEEVEEVDMRVVVRLLGEVAACPGGLMSKRCHLLDGLCDFMEADEWVWAMQSRGNDAVCLGFLRRKRGCALPWPTSLPAAEFAESPLLPPAVSDSRVIVSRFCPDAHAESRIALLRTTAASPFSERQALLVSHVLDELHWLHCRTEESHAPSRFSPRLQLVSDLLLLGFGRKEIADRLGISPGTVCGYMRTLYRQFGVNSQAEYIRKLREELP